MFEQYLDFAVLAFVERHREPTIGAATAINNRADRTIANTVDGDTLGEPRKLRLIQNPMGANSIGARESLVRMFEIAREASIIGQQQKPLGVDIETPHRHHPRED